MVVLGVCNTTDIGDFWRLGMLAMAEKEETRQRTEEGDGWPIGIKRYIIVTKYSYLSIRRHRKQFEISGMWCRDFENLATGVPSYPKGCIHPSESPRSNVILSHRTLGKFKDGIRVNLL